MSDPAVLTERRGAIFEITLNRPDKKNPFNPEMLVRLADAWDELDADPDLRVGIVTGAGGNFSAGADLDRLVGALLAGEEPANEFEARLQADLSIIWKGFLKEYQPTKPIIAAVEGYCYAGGTEILQGFDVRVAGENAQIAISEVCRGLFPMGGSAVRLPRQIPFTVASEMLLTGLPISGTRAAEVGLVGHAVPDGTALDVARELAEAIAANGPVAVRNIKACIRESEFAPEAEAFEREMALGMEVMGTKDAREGPKAFLEKRTPNFVGE